MVGDVVVVESTAVRWFLLPAWRVFCVVALLLLLLLPMYGQCTYAMLQLSS